MNLQDLHILFSQIINGVSLVSDSSFGNLYIKHLNQLDLILIQREYNRHFQEAKDKKIPTYLEKEKQIISNGDWTQEKENRIKEAKSYIEAIQDKLSKEYLFSRRKIFKKEIVEANERIDKLLMEKGYLIGFTAEQFANKKCIGLQIGLAIHTDNLLIKKFSIEDINDENKYNQLVELYEKTIKDINQETFQRIAISSFFNNMFSICGDNAYYFYGKPVVQLTTFQVDLFLWGRYFKNQLSQYGSDIPPSMAKNPDDMLEFFQIRENTKKSKILEGGDEDTVGTTIMGANKEDMKLMGIDTSQIKDIGKEIQKHGGFLSKDDLYKFKNG